MHRKRMLRVLPMSMAAIALCCTTLVGAPMRALGQDTPPPPAQGQETPPPPAQGQGRGMMMNPKAQLDMMSTHLNLTDDQKPKVQAILEDRQKQMMAIMQGSNEKIKALLTDDQKTKFDAMMARMRGGRGPQAGGEATPPMPPPK